VLGADGLTGRGTAGSGSNSRPDTEEQQTYDEPAAKYRIRGTPNPQTSARFR
jgi:hypothetical protein